MSSLAVRQLVKDFLDANSAEIVVDITGEFGDLREVLAYYEVQPDAPWLGLEFSADEEFPVSLSATNDQGLYREVGIVQLHVCAIARLGAGQDIVSRAEVLRDLFRGERIGGIVVESVSPVNTGPGATMEFEAGYVSGTITIGYRYDLTPTP